jgi:hypothetical protein
MMKTVARLAIAASIFLTPSTQYAQMIPGANGPMSPTSGSSNGGSGTVTPSATPPCLLNISVSLCTGGLS